MEKLDLKLQLPRCARIFASSRCIFPLLLYFYILPSGECLADKRVRVGVGGSFSLGAAIPKGDLWDVVPRTAVGFGLSAGVRIVFGNSCTEPTVFFLPMIVDTKKSGGMNGSLLPVLVGMQIYPYAIGILYPYFMFGAGYGKLEYEGPNPAVLNLNQEGSARGVVLMVGGGVDFNLYRWFHIGPSFYWLPIWYFDCSKSVEKQMTGSSLCDPTEDHWRVKFWFIGLRASANFDW